MPHSIFLINIIYNNFYIKIKIKIDRMYEELHLNRLNIFKLFIIFTKWHSSQKIKTMIKN